MNILVASYLSGYLDQKESGIFLGGFIDMQKNQEFPPFIKDGYFQSKRIEKYYKNSPILQRSIERLSRKYKRNGISCIELFYDHLLAKRWPLYTGIPLKNHLKNLYDQLKEYQPIMTYKQKKIAISIRRNDLLLDIGTIHGLHHYIKKLEKNNACPALLQYSIDDLCNDYSGFLTDFDEFMPLLTKEISDNKIVESWDIEKKDDLGFKPQSKFVFHN